MKKKMTAPWNLFHGKRKYFWVLLLTAAFLTGCSQTADVSRNPDNTQAIVQQITEEPDSASLQNAVENQNGAAFQNAADGVQVQQFSLDAIPPFTTEPYVAVNNNVPYFNDSEMTTTAFENYSDLDELGRCGVAYANICKELMPTEKRGEIGSVRPSGWHTVKYDIVDGKYLYNRCHLIGFQLAGENANNKNLITGTRYMNVDGMLPFENMVADYVKETGNHVLYRVTPVFEGDNLVASGVLMEAKSVEDNGEGILFNVYCYNNQPGVTIDYATGESSLASGGSEVQEQQSSDVIVHISDSGSKYHSAGCQYLKDSDNEVTLEEAKSRGLTPCSKCNPPQ